MLNNLNGTLNTVLTIAVCMIVIGALLQFFPGLGLPGDIHIQGETFSFHCPVGSMVVGGIIMAVILRVLKRL